VCVRTCRHAAATVHALATNKLPAHCCIVAQDANGGRALLAELGSGAALSDLPHVTPVSATSVPVLLVNSVNKQPEGEALPASDSVVTTTYGTGADAVDCALVNVPDPATNVTRSQCVRCRWRVERAASCGLLCIRCSCGACLQLGTPLDTPCTLPTTGSTARRPTPLPLCSPPRAPPASPQSRLWSGKQSRHPPLLSLLRHRPAPSRRPHRPALRHPRPPSTAPPLWATHPPRQRPRCPRPTALPRPVTATTRTCASLARRSRRSPTHLAPRGKVRRAGARAVVLGCLGVCVCVCVCVCVAQPKVVSGIALCVLSRQRSCA
jgi:hypothetical protein